MPHVTQHEAAACLQQPACRRADDAVRPAPLCCCAVPTVPPWQVQLDEMLSRNQELDVQLAAVQRMYTREVRLREVLKVRRGRTGQGQGVQAGTAR